MRLFFRTWMTIVTIAAIGSPAYAFGLIRDDEIETTLQELSAPIFSAAGLDPEAVRIFLVNDQRLNAFVAGGQNLFIHTGLLQSAEGLDQVAGVIAHEAGHIAGGHLTRLSQASDKATAEAILGAVLGAAAAVAGAPQLGTAIIAGGATVAERGFLRFNRGQEQAADQAAIGYLHAAGISPRGLLEFFRILDNRNLRISTDGAEFLRTHPLTRNRIAFLERQVEASPLVGQEESAQSQATHARIVAKLDGFLDDRSTVLRQWQGNGFADRYARLIADYRDGRIDAALGELSELIDADPGDPYLYELQGQISFESGRIAQAVQSYSIAVDKRPGSALFRLGLARALIESNEADRLTRAIAQLEAARQTEPRNASVHRFMGIALGRSGRPIEADLSFAESAILRGDKADANIFLKRARKGVKSGTSQWLKLQDLTRAHDELS